MFVYRLVGMVFFLRTLARIFYRKAELRLLCRTAHRRAEEIRKLVYVMGHVFQDRTLFVTGIRWSTFNNMGYPTDTEGNRAGPICWNCPIGITVYVADLPCIGLGLELRGQALCIRQMQGVRGFKPLRNLQDWPELLVRICMLHAKNEGLKEVRVYKANQDIGFEFPDIEPVEGQGRKTTVRMHQDRMRRRYDRTAHTLKFKKTKKYYVWENPDYARPR